MKKILLSIVVLGSLAGCSSSDNYEDLSSWMKQEEKKMVGKIQPLPDVKTYVHTPFAIGIETPFEMQVPLSLQQMMKNRYAPDINRKKEPLEDFPIDNLKMVGSVKKDGKTFGLIKDRDGIIHYVTVGSHLGLNFGEIISLTDNEIVIDERMRDGDEWKIVKTNIQLTLNQKTSNKSSGSRKK